LLQDRKAQIDKNIHCILSANIISNRIFAFAEKKNVSCQL